MRFEKATAMQRFVECHFIILDRNTVIFVEPPDLALPYFLVKIYHKNHTFAVFTKTFKIRHQRADDINESVRMREGNPCNYKLSLQDIFHVNSPSNNIATFSLFSTESNNNGLRQYGFLGIGKNSKATSGAREVKKSIDINIS